MNWVHPTGRTPKLVNIIACGPTHSAYHAAHWQYNPPVPRVDETWSLNKGLRTVRADLGFVMDDMVGEARTSERFREDLDALGIPLITSIVDEEVRRLYPSASLIPYPLDDVLDYVGLLHLLAATPSERITPSLTKAAGDVVGYYLHNSIPYILAYAAFIGVRRVHLFGADYTFPGNPVREDDRANTEYWVGLLRGFGIEVWVPGETTLLNTRDGLRLYGFGARAPKRRQLDAPVLDDLCLRVFDNAPHLRPLVPIPTREGEPPA